MVKKLAIDWDESELRLVAAQCSGRSVKVTDAAVIPVTDAGVLETLRSAITRRGLEDTETLVAIGRGKAELRELQLPPVPDEELPDIVRFQAIRSFATAGDSAIVDFLVTNRDAEAGVEMIAAAVGPSSLTEIRETCQAAELSTKRISLRPLAAAALYLIHHASSSNQDTVLIDLLADDAEIVVAREGRVIFVRTVRMPSDDATRGRALAGELRRSLVACGSSGSLDRVILWGRSSVHSDDLQMLAEASGSQVEVLDPFELVDLDRKTRADLPEHVGRLAPLVGLLAADEEDADRLVDFLNPRRRIEETTSPYRAAVLLAIPVVATLLLGYAVYRQMKGLDQKIADLQSANEAMKPNIDSALESIARTEKVDQFLDGDVNWLNEVRRLAVAMPPSSDMIVQSVSATSDSLRGGGTLTIKGAVTNPSVIDRFEAALRDDDHRVTGEGTNELKTGGAYRWGFTESITLTADSIRNDRYAAMNAPPPAAPSAETPSPAAPSDEPPADESPSSEPPADEAPATEAPATEAPATEAPAPEAPASGAGQRPAEAEPPPDMTPAEEASAGEKADSQPESERSPSDDVVSEANSEAQS